MGGGVAGFHELSERDAEAERTAFQIFAGDFDGLALVAAEALDARADDVLPEGFGETHLGRNWRGAFLSEERLVAAQQQKQAKNAHNYNVIMSKYDNV